MDNSTCMDVALVFVQISTASGTTITDEDKAPLRNLLDTVTDGTAAYYTAGDNWNGKRYDKDGHWAAFTAADGPRDKAQAVLDNPGSVQAITDAAAALKAAIADLVPTAQANTTGLYEALARAAAITDESAYTASTWAAFETTSSTARTVLNSLFYQSGDTLPAGKAVGDATDTNVAGYQGAVTLAADTLTAACHDLLSVNAEKAVWLWNKSASWLLTQSEPAQGDFTEASLSAWTNARAELQSKAAAGYDTATKYTAYRESIVAAATAYYGLTDAKDSISVHVRVADNYGAAYPEYALTDAATAAYDGDVSLCSGKTVGDLMAAIGYRADSALPKIGDSANKIMQPYLYVYVNGTLLVDRIAGDWVGFLMSGTGTYTNAAIQGVQLHNGDDVVLVRAAGPATDYYGVWNSSTPYSCYYPYAALLNIAAGQNTMVVEAGKEFSLTVTKTNGAPESPSRVAQPSSGVSLFLSAVQTSEAAAKTAPALTDTGIKTGSDGTANAAICTEGWYRLAAVNVTEQTPAASAQGVAASGGAFPNLAGGDYILVHVVPSSDDKTVRAGFQSELDKVYQAYGEDYYTAEQWENVRTAYVNATRAISDSTLLGDAYKAEQTAAAAIEAIQKTTAKNNETKLYDVSWSLSRLPDEAGIRAGKFTQGYRKVYQILAKKYAALTQYQKSQLTTAQQEQFEALRKAYGTDGSTLPAAVRPSVTITVADGAQYQDQVKIGNWKTYMTGVTAYYAEGIASMLYDTTYDEAEVSNPGAADSNYKQATMLGGFNDSGYHVLEGGSYSLNLGVRLSTTDVEIYKIEVEGADSGVTVRPKLTSGKSTFMTDSAHGAAYYLRGSVDISGMPANNVTIKLYLRSSTDIKPLAEQREIAKTGLAAVYAGYAKSNYSSENWAKLTAAYNSGLTAIGAAADAAGIACAKSTAVKAMAAVATRAQEQAGGTGGSTVGTLGSVHVVVENTTYSGAADKLRGEFINETVALNNDSTMMSCVLAALEKNGYSWIGTGGTTATGTDITYLATVGYGGASLSEFDGANTAGWMGTLNDWFTNESFASYTALASGRDYRIVDGDEIRVVFSLSGYGSDLGGSWGSSDTSLKALEATGGTLSPAFSGGTTSYILSLNSGSKAVSVTPAAANKNYQVKTFLNQKITAKGAEYYRRGESIPVKAGDVIYIGVGEYGWLSMNNQGAEAISYSGTWYTIKVVDSSNADSVVSLISDISAVTYSNYRANAEKTAAARAAYDGLSGDARANVTNYAKLTAAEAAITKFRQIDSVKTLLAAIPAIPTSADMSAVQAAYNAYNALTAEQKGYITVKDVEKYNAAVEKLGVGKSISGSASVPGSATIEQTAAVSGTTATATIPAASVTSAISAVKDSGDKAITIIPTGTGSATAIAVSISKASAQAIVDGTSASVVIETGEGHVTIPNDTLAQMISAAAGSDLAVTVARGTAGDVTDKTVDTAGALIAKVTVTSGGGNITTFGGKSLTVDIPADSTFTEGTNYKVIIISAAGKTETAAGRCVKIDGRLYAEVSTTHLSTFVVTNEKSMNFTDVKSGDWYYDAVKYAYGSGLFNGTSDTAFSPGATMTRGMLVTVLYRLDGKPAVTGTSIFTDVAAGRYCTDAVNWASANKIVDGCGSGRFGPDSSITREQMAAILYRYAAYKKYDVTKSGDLAAFTDAGSISSYALGAMKWANAESLVNGRTDTALVPSGNATRAEVATILMRLCKNIVK